MVQASFFIVQSYQNCGKPCSRHNHTTHSLNTYTSWLQSPTINHNTPNNANTNIQECLNISKPAHRTLLATIDISKAFDSVLCTLLIQKIFNSDIDTHKEMNCQLSYRKTRTHNTQWHAIHNKSLHKRSPSRVGTLADTFQPLHARHPSSRPPRHDTHILSCADITIASQHTTPETAAAHLQE